MGRAMHDQGKENEFLKEIGMDRESRVVLKSHISSRWTVDLKRK
jgi:hypothetical protein